MDTDDGLRASEGVVVCLRPLEGGRSRIIIDDVKGDSDSNPIRWSFDACMTWKDYGDGALDQMDLGKEEYRIIGENVVARLLALNRRLK